MDKDRRYIIGVDASFTDTGLALVSTTPANLDTRKPFMLIATRTVKARMGSHKGNDAHRYRVRQIFEKVVETVYDWQAIANIEQIAVEIPFAKTGKVWAPRAAGAHGAAVCAFAGGLIIGILKGLGFEVIPLAVGEWHPNPGRVVYPAKVYNPLETPIDELTKHERDALCIAVHAFEIKIKSG